MNKNIIQILCCLATLQLTMLQGAQQAAKQHESGNISTITTKFTAPFPPVILQSLQQLKAPNVCEGEKIEQQYPILQANLCITGDFFRAGLARTGSFMENNIINLKIHICDQDGNPIKLEPNTVLAYLWVGDQILYSEQPDLTHFFRCLPISLLEGKKDRETITLFFKQRGSDGICKIFKIILTCQPSQTYEENFLIPIPFKEAFTFHRQRFEKQLKTKKSF